MPEVTNSAVIAASAERLFDSIAQAERNVEWVPDLERSERLTPGPTRKGSRFHFLVRFAGIPVEVTDEVVEFEPPRLIRFAGVEGVRHSGFWRFEPLPASADGGPQTRVTYSMAFDLPPGIGPLVATLINLPVRLDAQSQASLAALRRLVE
jgi:hypothetical protein